MSSYAEGENYRFTLVAGRAGCVVWRRRDLDSNAGARSAEGMLVHFRALAEDPEVRSFLLDIRKAPPFSGPRTQQALGLAFAAFEGNRTPIAVLPASVLQGLQIQRSLALHAPLYGRDFSSAILAEDWLKSLSKSPES
ncbi:MAG: hypothetical protein KUG77_22485 [Nannocystaceae bacterium]|nr:hypothetical protein [Nannocystaceae bacterium]